MNEPERRKPLTGNSAEFLAAINRIHDDPNVRADIVTRAGTAFSSGGDVRNVQRQANGGVTHMEIRHEYRTGIQQLPLALFILEVPVIAAINGTAVGAGLDLACLCDIRLASDELDGSPHLHQSRPRGSPVQTPVARRHAHAAGYDSGDVRRISGLVTPDRRSPQGGNGISGNDAAHQLNFIDSRSDHLSDSRRKIKKSFLCRLLSSAENSGLDQPQFNA